LFILSLLCPACSSFASLSSFLCLSFTLSIALSFFSFHVFMLLSCFVILFVPYSLFALVVSLFFSLFRLVPTSFTSYWYSPDLHFLIVIVSSYLFPFLILSSFLLRFPALATTSSFVTFCFVSISHIFSFLFLLRFQSVLLCFLSSAVPVSCYPCSYHDASALLFSFAVFCLAYSVLFPALIHM